MKLTILELELLEGGRLHVRLGFQKCNENEGLWGDIEPNGGMNLMGVLAERFVGLKPGDTITLAEARAS